MATDPDRTLEALLAIDAWARTHGEQRTGELRPGDANVTEPDLAEIVLDARCRAAELSLALGRPDDAAALAERALAVRPVDERALRAVVLAMTANGEMAAARIAYDHALAVIAEAGRAPQAATRTAGRRIR